MRWIVKDCGAKTRKRPITVDTPQLSQQGIADELTIGAKSLQFLGDAQHRLESVALVYFARGGDEFVDSNRAGVGFGFK